MERAALMPNLAISITASRADFSAEAENTDSLERLLRLWLVELDRWRLSGGGGPDPTRGAPARPLDQSAPGAPAVVDHAVAPGGEPPAVPPNPDAMSAADAPRSLADPVAAPAANPAGPTAPHAPTAPSGTLAPPPPPPAAPAASYPVDTPSARAVVDLLRAAPEGLRIGHLRAALADRGIGSTAGNQALDDLERAGAVAVTGQTVARRVVLLAAPAPPAPRRAESELVARRAEVRDRVVATLNESEDACAFPRLHHFACAGGFPATFDDVRVVLEDLRREGQIGVSSVGMTRLYRRRSDVARIVTPAPRPAGHA